MPKENLQITQDGVVTYDGVFVAYNSISPLRRIIDFFREWLWDSSTFKLDACRDLRTWKVRARCPCGRGNDFHDPEKDKGPAAQEDKWFCPSCGSSALTNIAWVGRRYAGQWEWVEVHKLPPKLKPRKDGDDKKDSIIQPKPEPAMAGNRPQE